MNVKFTDRHDSKDRDELIKQILPKQTIISTTLEPKIEKALFHVLAECVKQELEIYRAYPKKTLLEKKEEPKEMVKSFDPRNNGTCYMGKAFKANDNLTDWELTQYRKAIGTIPHPIWGNCTLLEIWGGDHFEEHNDMVVGAFKYGMNINKTCPTIKFHVNPLFQNKKSKNFKLSPAQQEHKDMMDELLAKAIVFGVNTPKEAMRKRRNR